MYKIKLNKIINKESNNITDRTSGFTLIEVMVSVTLFAMVMTLSLGAILSIIDGNKKAQAINSVANNLNFAVDSMVRDIKTGYAYTCAAQDLIVSPTQTSNIGSDHNGCQLGSPVNAITLVSTITGERRGVRYSLETDPETGKGRIYKITTDVDTKYPVTSPEVDVTRLDFYVDNPETTNFVGTEILGQPKILLHITGTATVNKSQTSDFTIQTLISQRNLNVPK